MQYRYTDRTESDISWIGSCQLCLFFLLALVAGPLFDKGRFRYLIGSGSILWTLSVFLIPEAKTFGESMVVQGILGGLGVGLLFIPSLSIQSHWFAKKRSLAIGLVASGTSVGGICFPIMLNKLIANPKVGFTNGVRAGTSPPCRRRTTKTRLTSLLRSNSRSGGRRLSPGRKFDNVAPPGAEDRQEAATSPSQADLHYAIHLTRRWGLYHELGTVVPELLRTPNADCLTRWL